MAALAVALSCAAPLCWLSSAALAVDVVRVGGTGMALAAMKRLGAELALLEPSIRVDVLPSLGTQGGLAALRDGAVDIVVTGRPLKPGEKAAGASEIGCFTTPLAFASSHPAPPAIAKADLPRLYREANPTWPDGKPLVVVLRSRAGSENAYLSAAVPGLGPAIEEAYRRSGVPVATTDQENAEVAQRTPGSLAIISLLQLRAEDLNLRLVPLDGVVPSAENVARGDYPLTAQVCLARSEDARDAAKKVTNYALFSVGAALFERLGAERSK